MLHLEPFLASGKTLKMGTVLACVWLGTLMTGCLGPGNGTLVAAKNTMPVPTLTRDAEKAEGIPVLASAPSSTPATALATSTPRVIPPDGSSAVIQADLAFATRNAVYISAFDGTGGREVATGVCPVDRGGVRALAVSPSGRSLAFICGPPKEGRPNGPYLLDLASGNLQRIAYEASDGWDSLAWSPDGRYLAYLVPVNLGPAPFAAREMWAYEVATSRHIKLDRARYFVGSPVWDPDGSAIVYLVGSWQHSTGPVATYRVSLGGREPAVWRQDVHAIVPRTNGEWLGVQEPRDREGDARIVVIALDGTVTPLGPPVAVGDRPIGWLGSEPVIWHRTEPPGPFSAGRGEIWLMGDPTRRLLAGVPLVDVRSGSVAIAGERLLYHEEGRSGNFVWLADLSTGQKSRFAVSGRGPLSMRPDG